VEALIAAAGVVLISIATILAALFQSRRRGKAEGEAEHHEYKAEQLEEVLDDVRVADAARSAASVDPGKRSELHRRYNRDQKPPQ
jgi:hypothetical protein